MNAEKRVERFEDLIAWQEARLFTAEIYRVTSQGPIAREFGSGTKFAVPPCQGGPRRIGDERTRGNGGSRAQ